MSNFKNLSTDLIANNIVNAIENNDLSKIIQYLSYIDIDFDKGLFLNTAARLGHLEIIQYLVQHGANISIQHNMPLMHTCLENHEMCFYFLLEHGANPLDRNFEIIYQLIKLGNFQFLHYLSKHFEFELPEKQVLIQLHDLVERTNFKIKIKTLRYNEDTITLKDYLSTFQTLYWYLLEKQIPIQEPLEELFWKYPHFTQVFLTYVLAEHEDKFLLLKSICISEEFQCIYQKIQLKYELDKNLNDNYQGESGTQKI